MINSKDTLEELLTIKVLYLSQNTWYYLAGQQEMSTYSAWLSGVNEHSLHRLLAYYEINPHKLPDIVYAEAIYEDIAMAFCEELNYQAQTVEEGIILLPQ